MFLSTLKRAKPAFSKSLIHERPLQSHRTRDFSEKHTGMVEIQTFFVNSLVYKTQTHLTAKKKLKNRACHDSIRTRDKFVTMKL